MAGLGAALEVDLEGADRFSRASACVRDLFAELSMTGDVAPASAGPLLFGGFALVKIASIPSTRKMTSAQNIRNQSRSSYG